MSSHWYYSENGNNIGPLEEAQLIELARSGAVKQETLVWAEGMGTWMELRHTDVARHLPALPPTPLPHPAQMPSVPGNNIAKAASANWYEPASFRSLWLWYAWLLGAGVPLSAIVIGAFGVLAGQVLFLVLLYRFWSVIQDGRVRTTPGKAVGFCFIPFFNFYWAFQVIPGLASDMNAYCNERSISGPRVNERTAMTSIILGLCSVIPYVGIVLSIAAMVLVIIVMRQFAETAASICEAKRSVAAPKFA